MGRQAEIVRRGGENGGAEESWSDVGEVVAAWRIGVTGVEGLAVRDEISGRVADDADRHGPVDRALLPPATGNSYGSRGDRWASDWPGPHGVRPRITYGKKRRA